MDYRMTQGRAFFGYSGIHKSITPMPKFGDCGIQRSPKLKEVREAYPTTHYH